MKRHEECPVCAGQALAVVGTCEMKRVDPPRTVQQGGINAMLRHVLAREMFVAQTLLCRRCRHMFLSPTFEEAELDRLYSPEFTAEIKRQYRESERVSGRSWAEQHGIQNADQQALRQAADHYRPKRLVEFVSSAAAPGPNWKILDFGSRSGELIAGFPRECHRYVYDKDLSAFRDADTVPIRSFGDIRAQGPFNLILLSHVLEHVPAPAKLLAELGGGLAAGGLVYVEVPLGYCGALVRRRGFPLGPHVNYFTRTSLLACIRSAGLRSAIVRREISPYGECQTLVFKAIARRPDAGGREPWHRPWPVDLFIDAVLMYGARKWRRRFE